MVATQSTRSQLRAWITSELQDQAEIKLPALSQKAIEVFSQQPVFIRSLLEEMLPSMVYDLAKSVVSGTRNNGDERQFIAGDSVMTQQAIKERGRQISSRWKNFLEHTGDRHVRLLDMTKSDLLQAAQERRQRGLTELRYANLWEELASKLKDNQKVGDKFTEEQIERMNQRINNDEGMAA